MTDAELRERLHAQCDYLLDQAADRLEALANKLQRMEEALSETRAERDALLQKPIDLAKMDSIDEDATDKMIAYYWWQQAQEARAALKD